VPVKVLQVIGRLEIGGMERAVIRLASRAAREGTDQSLLLFDQPFRSELLDFNPGPLATEYIQRRPGIDLRFAARLARKLAQARVNVVHAHNDTAIFYAALALVIGRLAMTSLIGTFRNWPTHDTAGARLLTRWAAGRATEIVAVSHELKGRLQRSGWVGKSRTIWNGVDLTEFSPKGHLDEWRTEFGVPADAIVVGHVGRFAPIKRHTDLFDCAAALLGAQPPIYFAVAGNGPLFDSFRQRALDIPNVVLLSNIRDVAAFLRSIDIFVLCSEHEGAPQALLEAMACARPIVATRVGGVPHLLGADGPAPAGRLVPPLRPDLLAAEILCLARDGSLRRNLAKLAGERAQAFSFDREWAEYAALYSAAALRSAAACNR
jgi:L-malate glycosyltransferase